MTTGTCSSGNNKARQVKNGIYENERHENGNRNWNFATRKWDEMGIITDSCVSLQLSSCDALTVSNGILVQAHLGVVVADLAVWRQFLRVGVPELEQQQLGASTFRRPQRGVMIAVIYRFGSLVFLVILRTPYQLHNRYSTTVSRHIYGSFLDNGVNWTCFFLIFESRPTHFVNIT